MEWRKCRSCYNGGSKFDSLMYVQKDLVVAWMQSKIYFRQQSAPIDQKEFALITTKIFPLTTCKFRAAKCDTSEWTASYLITNELIGRRHAPLLVQPRWSEGALQSHELRGLPHRVTICSSVRVGFLQLGKRKERRRAIFHLQNIRFRQSKESPDDTQSCSEHKVSVEQSLQSISFSKRKQK